MTATTMPRPWDEAPRTIFTVLGAGHVRAVGGCVRDALLGRAGGDIDFATILTPDEVTARLSKAGIAVKPTGLLHGTVTAIVQGKGYEITTLRRDVATDGRRAVVAYTTDWAEDAQRRDFTVNALYADEQGLVYDGTGAGLADLASKRLRFIGVAEDRIREDYLRVLRLFRFVAQLGFDEDEDALQASTRQKQGLSQLSAERVTEEWLKLLRARYASAALTLMERARIDALYNVSIDAQPRLAAAHALNAPLSDALLIALAFEDVPPAFRLSGKVEKGVHLLMFLKDGDMSFEEAAYRHGADSALDLALWRAIADGDTVDPATLAYWQGYAPPQSPVTSAPFIAQGLQGPALGEAIRTAEEAWIRDTFR